ncbi:TPA: hypothetical protein ACHVEU_001162 [Streptococcus suis]
MTKEIEKLKKQKSKAEETLKDVTKRLQKAQEKQALDFAKKLSKRGIYDEDSFEQYLQKVRDETLEEFLETDDTGSTENHP